MPRKQTRTTADDNAPAAMRSRRLSQSQLEELKAILENKWWPFKRADAKLLEKAHRKLKQAQASPIEDALI